MRLLVCGCRGFTDSYVIGTSIWQEFNVTEFPTLASEATIIHGACKGSADEVAGRWADQHGSEAEPFPADWSKGQSAGPIRNQQMLDEGKPDRVLAFWDGESRGTHDMIKRAVRAGVPVRIVPVRREGA